jgi:hypothetical protein
MLTSETLMPPRFGIELRPVPMTLEFWPIEAAPIQEGKEFGPVWGRPGVHRPMEWIYWDGRAWYSVRGQEREYPIEFAYPVED